MEKQPVMLKGFFRVQIENQDGSLHGNSGWQENEVTNLGFRNFLVYLMGASAGSIRVTHVALGSGTAPGASDTSLQGEVVKRKSGTFSEVSSKTAQWVATFGSSDSFVTNTQTLRNIGLFGTSSGGTIFAGNTYTTSSCATNQNVNVTYQIRFSTN